MARFLSGSPKIMFALYSAVILLLGIVLIIEKMPDGNKAFEWSAEQTLLLTEKVLISNRYITVSAIDRSLKEYKNPFNQLWQKLTHRSFAWIDSTSHFPDLKPEEQFPNESASQYLGRLCEFPQKKSEEQFFNESASQYLERLCERRRLLKDSISNNINVP
jgi:glutathionylspermidine synthase